MTTAPAQERQSCPSIPRNLYRHWRRVLRDNGGGAYQWMVPPVLDVFEQLRDQVDDDLADRRDVVAYARREGLAVTMWHLAPRQLVARFQDKKISQR